MRNNIIIKLIKYQILNILLYVVFTLLISIIIKHSANVSQSIGSKINFYYWLSPTFAPIQTCNQMLLFGGVVAYVTGVLFPIKNLNNKDIFRNSFIIMISNTINLVFCIITTLIFELFAYDNEVISRANIVFHSLNISFFFIVFLSFWSLVGYGLKLSFDKPISLIIFGLMYQGVEYFKIYISLPKLEKYLPLALSREIVINQFPYWKKDSWAFVENVGTFANTTLITDIHVTNFWIAIFLSSYFAISFVVPILKNMDKNKLKGRTIEGMNYD